MKILVSNPQFYYQFFYLLSGLIVLFSVVIFSIKNGFPLMKVLFLLSTVSLMTVIGTRLFTIPALAWSTIIKTGSSGSYENRSAIGGLLFGLASLLFAYRFFGLKRPLLDFYAWITPVAFGIQKLGCFFNGCCYGVTTQLPWGVQYPRFSSAHFHHWSNQLIDDSTQMSLPVHPVQLYEMLAFFLIAFIVWRTKNRWSKSGSSLFFSLALIFVFRFVLEFIRDPESSQFIRHYLIGIRVFEWFLLLTGLLFLGVTFLNEKVNKHDPFGEVKSELSLNTITLYTISIAITTYLFRGLFSKVEIITLCLRFIPAILLVGFYILKILSLVRLQLINIGMLVFSFLLMSQTIPTDTLKTKVIRKVDIGFSAGKIGSDLKHNPQQGECGTIYDTDTYAHQYSNYGIGYSRITNQDNSTLTLGFNVFIGSDKQENLTQFYTRTDWSTGINPYFRTDFKWIGLGFGGYFGKIDWIPTKPIDEFEYLKGTKTGNFKPEIMFRVGRLDIFNLQVNYAVGFPSPFPANLGEFSFGSGFGYTSDYQFKIGYTSPFKSLFVAGEALFNKNIGIRFEYYFPPSSNKKYIENDLGRFALGLNYRFLPK